ncbi:MAG: P-loop NTPase fold protein [Candidatus Sedimenticola sp. 20ELBAFRAG]
MADKKTLEPSLEDVEKSLEQHVFNSDEPIVVSINGGWGEGKTYFWKQYVKKKHRKDKVAYVSVFGATSLKDIRQRVVASILLRTDDIDDSEEQSRLSKLITIVNRFKGNVLDKLLNKIGLPDGLATQLIESQMLNPQWVLCIDDIERINKSISTEEILGYIDELREEYGLRIVLIYNLSRMKEREGDFVKYHEKIVDRQLVFYPDIKEQIARVFQPVSFIVDNQEYIDNMIRYCHVLNLRNIRLLVRVRHFVQDVLKELPDNPDKGFINNVVSSLTLFVWIRYGKEEGDLPDVNYIKQFSSYASASRDIDDDENEDELKADNLLNSYGYQYTDDVDLVLMNFVETDTLDCSKFKSLYSDYCDDAGKAKLTEKYRAIWKEYFHATLVDNSKEFCELLRSASIDAIEYLSVIDIDTSMHVLRQLGYDEYADELWNAYLSKHPPEQSNFDNPFGNEIRTPEATKYVADIRKESDKDDRLIDEVIENFKEDRFINQRDRIKLSEFTVDDYVGYFMNRNESSLVKVIFDLAGASRKIQNPDKYELRLSDTMIEVVKKLSEENEINRVRFEAIGLIKPNAKE